jgi:hypothetical protein
MYTRQTISKAIEALTWGFPDAPEVTVEEVVDFLGDGERMLEKKFAEWFDDEEVEILKGVLDLKFEAASIATALAMDAKAGTYWIDVAVECLHDDAEAALRSWRRLHRRGD